MDIQNILQESILLTFFKKGYYRLSGAASLTDVDGFGILVAADTIFDTGCDTGDNGKRPAPAEDEEWKAGFYFPMPVKSFTLKSGTIYIGRK